MAESQITQSADLQTTLATILVSIQTIRYENKSNIQSIREDVNKQNKTLHEENTKNVYSCSRPE